jgi:hypothetical protein
VLRKSLTILAMAAVTPAATAVDPSRQAISYICGAEQAGGGSGPREVKRQEGVGNSRLTIATSNPEAQAWFDYGLQMADGFYHEDAKTAFASSALALSCSALGAGTFMLSLRAQASPHRHTAHSGSAATALAKAVFASS